MSELGFRLAASMRTMKGPAGVLPPLAGKMAGAIGRLKGWLAGHI